MENTEVKTTLSSTENIGKQLGKMIVMQMYIQGNHKA